MTDIIILSFSVVFAILAIIFANKKWGDILTILSFILYCVAPLNAIFDMLIRLNENDIIGIVNIYPFLSTMYIIVFFCIVVLSCCKLLIKK